MSGAAPRLRAIPSRSVGPLSGSSIPASMAGDPALGRKSPPAAFVNCGSAVWFDPLAPFSGPVDARKFEWLIVTSEVAVASHRLGSRAQMGCPGENGADPPVPTYTSVAALSPRRIEFLTETTRTELDATTCSAHDPVPEAS